ncbi:GYD domain-containing protein [Pseudonocardia sp. H11422]|uniref:GYD domain-containing protein n=1 Tax=Pseudonocardia sp. H11422 TaxID=2835866 RepID=UPI001BDD67D1|nr:GYD domain-containing protein [Pseudonocardia sp. H11422]
MSKFAVFFSYKPETWDRMIMKPTDRTAAVRGLAEKLGGQLESLYFMFGDRDGFVVVDVPDTTDAAAISIAVASTGAFSHMETRQLIAPADLPAVLEKAASARESYRRPGD